MLLPGSQLGPEADNIIQSTYLTQFFSNVFKLFCMTLSRFSDSNGSFYARTMERVFQKIHEQPEVLIQIQVQNT